MNALAKALRGSAPKDSGSFRRGRVVKACLVANSQSVAIPPVATVRGEFVKTVGGLEATFVTQRLTLDDKSWASRNVDQVLGSAIALPTDDLLAATERAVASLQSRENEDVDEWAKKLGDQFGSYTD